MSTINNFNHTATTTTDLLLKSLPAIRKSSIYLASVSSTIRSRLLQQFAQQLITSQSEIKNANLQDLQNCTNNDPLRSRLSFDSKKIETVILGIQQLAQDQYDPIGNCLERREITPGLILERIRVPLGVILVIFESRPDVFPQLLALAIRSGNAVLLKGGKESLHTLQCLLQLWLQALEAVCIDISTESITYIKTNILNDSSSDMNESDVRMKLNNMLLELRSIVTLVETRESVGVLLTQTQHIDMIIPRGSSRLVQSIQQNTTIPVMGHSEGICHIYIDEQCNEKIAIEICIDSKTDYPSACNTVETILIHRSHCEKTSQDLQNNSLLYHLIHALEDKNVIIYGGPNFSKEFGFTSCPSLSHEYGSLAVTIEIVDTISNAIDHINRYSSHHTDSIITSNSTNAKTFTSLIDSACVFVNASTRFADGYRFGLGAEVGISTGRVHARGPVGIEGLCTYKWKMNSIKENGFTVTQHTNGMWKYSHKDLPLKK